MDPVFLETLRARALLVRRDVVGMLKTANVGRLLASLSAVELLVWLYGAVLKTSPGTATEAGRDRFVLSRVAAAPALYAVLAEHGFFDRDELWGYGRLGSLLQTEPECRRTPGVDVSCGTPGMGTGIALGLALSLKESKPAPKVLCLLGAEELEAGSTWEALNKAIAHVPENLTLIIECVEMAPSACAAPRNSIPLAERLSALGCEVACADGHDYASLQKAWGAFSRDRLHVILARTAHGKGLPSLAGKELDDATVLEPQITELLIRGLEDASS